MLTLLREVGRTVERRDRRREAYGASDPDARHSDAAWWRQRGVGARDMPSYTREQIRERALTMRANNPLASRYFRLMRQIVTSAPYVVTAVDEQVQELLDEFYGGAYNSWPAWLGAYSDALAACGRIVLPVHVSPSDATVRVSYADDQDVTGVEVDPQNPRRLLSVAVRGYAQPLPIVAAEWRRAGGRYGRLVCGDAAPRDDQATGALLFRVNHLANDTTGMSDLSAAIDPLTMHYEFQLGQMEAANVINRHVADVEVQGADEVKLSKVVERIKSLSGFGAYAVHNEGEKWTIGAASTQAGDAAERDRMAGNYATAPLGIPPHWLRGDFGDGNRAIATSSTDPALYQIQDRIDTIREIVRFACQFAIDAAVVYGGRTFEDETFSVTGPEVFRKDMAAGASTLTTLASALMVGTQQRWIPPSIAQEAYVRALAEVGQDVSVADVRAKLEDEGSPLDDAARERFAALAAEPDAEEEGASAGLPVPAGAERLADTVLNGAQVEAALAIVVAVSERRMPRDAGIGQLMAFFRLSEDQAESVMGTVGREFFAPAEAPPA